ncbi:MAG: hypothetical protein JWQ90_5499 [Hydrocarboniphaga sp.]|uniref:anti-sigma factor n=1 Tax=Hydrocarboniphaga sp. TaxID=2033016 RepID=UPI002626E493|nr:zf-HC2 domain-containing protein [Hydrocarboniphaga sp.]MDB5973049.1 hypothetical protein [Hydrocarboniphaga sp.]
MKSTDESASLHPKIWELIPWVVNGRATQAQRLSVETHLKDCADCRLELESQRRLQAALRHDPAPAQADTDPLPSLERLWRRIDAELAEDEAPPRKKARRSPRVWLLPALAAALIVETVGIAALAGAIWQRSAPVYRTLSAAPTMPATATIRVVLAPSLSLGEFQALLSQSQLQIVGGPGEAGVYSLAPLVARDAAAGQLALQQLRADPRVRFAEPVGTAQ